MHKATLMTTYNRLPVHFERGEGVYLWDNKNQRYLDALSGIAVCSLGHAHPQLTETIQKQAQKLLHTSNLYPIETQQILADKLCDLSGMENVFFCNSGAEANEAALKLARLHGHNKGMDLPQVIVMENSFHGRTLATLSATGNRKVQSGFEPLVQGFIRVPYNDIQAIKKVAKSQHNICAILVEPIQGEGGVQVPDKSYLSDIRQLCDQYDWLMMLDEIQTGIGRTGEYFAFQHTDIKPDVMSLAKALGNGIPIGATLARGKASQLFSAGQHGTTFGGNPFSCACANTVLTVLEQQNRVAHCKAIGQQILTDFKTQLAGVKSVVDIRGMGLMIGIELDHPCVDLVSKALAQKLLINVTADKVIRLLPPLIINKAQAQRMVEIVCELIKSSK